MSTTPNSDMPENLDLEWASRELIPFLELVFGETFGYEKKPTAHWVRMVLFAKFKLDRIPFYEDFPSTIERLRLCLITPEILTPAELTKFMRIAYQGEQLCIRIFVRHAIRHGTYDLYSLGRDASPQFPRPGKANRSQCYERNFTKPQHLAILDALQKQIDDLTANWKAAEDRLPQTVRTTHGRSGNADRAGHGSAVQTDRPTHATGGHHVAPAGYARHVYHRTHTHPAAPTSSLQHNLRPVGGYHQPYGPPYPGYHSMHGPSIQFPAPTQIGVAQDQQQQGLLQVQRQNLAGPPSSQWPYEVWHGNQMPYHPSEPNFFAPATSNAWAVQRPQPSVVSCQAPRLSLRERVYDPSISKHGQAAGPNPDAAAHVPCPDAPEFWPELPRKV